MFDLIGKPLNEKLDFWRWRGNKYNEKFRIVLKLSAKTSDEMQLLQLNARGLFSNDRN
jgi:hypothetical protein